MNLNIHTFTISKECHLWYNNWIKSAMADQPKNFLESHQATDLEDAVKLAIEGDIGAPVDYLLAHPKEVRPFCEALKNEAPFKSLSIFQAIITLLMNDAGEGDQPFKIEDSMPPDLKAAKKAVLEGKMSGVAAFLKTHPDQIGAFCAAILGSAGGFKLACQLAVANVRQILKGGKGDRDSFTVMSELLAFLMENNAENIKHVRGRIHELFDLTQNVKEDEARVDHFTKNARFILGALFIYPRIRFRSGGEQDPVPGTFLEDFFFEKFGADEADLRQMAKPLLDAGIQIEFHPAVQEGSENTPGYFRVSREALNHTIAEGSLIFKRKGDSLEFDILASAKARASSRGMKLVS